MHHDLIDNREQPLAAEIRRILPGTRAARFAVGYFFLSGLQSVADVLQNIQELRLLIGNTTNRETIEQIVEGYRRLEQAQEAAEAQAYPRRVEIAQAVAAAAAHLDEHLALMDQTDETQGLAQTLVDLIAQERLKVRVYTRGRLHAKAYIFDYGPIYDLRGNQLPRSEKGIGIVGSSNLTLAGITSNTELNVLVHGNANHAELTNWFEHLWNEAEPFDEHLMKALREGWPLAEVTPYEIYLKTLYELVHDSLGEADDSVFLWQDDIMSVLAEFQDRAVRRAIKMIRDYGGCFVADVVGLGKSYVGAAILKHFAEVERARPLIICPAHLQEMWEHYNEAYGLNARVLSMGMLREDQDSDAEWMLRDERYRYRDLVLVDESHNFRNPDSQRYRALQSYLSTNDRRCVFLTATPRNSSVWDIYHQIKLFHQSETTSLPVNPPVLRSYFEMVDKGARRLPALLSHILIRRTRHHVLRWYGYDAETDQRVDPEHFELYRDGERRAYILVGGRKHYFPRRRLQTIEYSIEATYQGLYQQLRGCLAGHGAGARACEALTYARYGLWDYVLPHKRNQRPYTELQRAGANLRGLMRIMLFKRFESSVYAFRESVRRILAGHRAFLQALDRGIVPAGDEARGLLYESDQLEEQALMDALRAVSGRYQVADLRLQALRKDISQDIRVLSRMLALTEPITSDKDEKLCTLLTWLQTPQVRQGKRLIFTQYADTAQYVHDHIQKLYPDAEVIYGQRQSKIGVVARFAPRANAEHRRLVSGPEFDTLVATDVLSEGLNLQDCGQVINYDLHWNPVRLIQRLGRIDRIGSEFDEIHAYNFLPETGLERNLGLRERLSRRIAEIHETIGEDAAILDPSERINEEAMYAIYTGAELAPYEDDGEDTLVDLQEAEEIIRQLRVDDPATFHRIANLADGVRCGRSVERPGTYVFLRAGRYRQLMLLDDTGRVITQDIPRVLSWLRCAPHTPPVALPQEHNRRVMGTKRQFGDEVQARYAERQHTLSFTTAQRYILAEFRVIYGATEHDDLRKQIAMFEEALSIHITRPAVRRELNRLQREGLQGLALVRAVSQIYTTYRLDLDIAQHNAAHRVDEEDQVPRIICSQAGVRL